MNRGRWSFICGPALYTTMLVLASSAAALAQASRAAITGTVTDTQGAVVSGANVTATNVGTGITRQVTTTGDGRYQFGSIFDPGTYTIKVEMQGFQSEVRNNVELLK